MAKNRGGMIAGLPQDTGRSNWRSFFALKVNGYLAVALMLTSSGLGLPAAVNSNEFLRAYAQEGEKTVCFDLPPDLVNAIDPMLVARRSLGVSTVEKPSAELLRAHYFEVGNRSNIPFEAALPRAVRARRWWLLTARGVVRFVPVKLRGELVIRVTREIKPAAGDQPSAFVQACGPATGAPTGAAYVAESRTLGPAWKAEPALGGGNIIRVNGVEYRLTPPGFGAPTATAILLIVRPGRPPVALADWSPAGNAESYCRDVFSLSELDPAGSATVLAESGSGCDV